MRYAFLTPILCLWFVVPIAGQPSDDTRHEGWSQRYESYFAKHMSSVSPRKDGWMLGTSLKHEASRASSFDMDDEIPLEVTLVAFQRVDHPPALNASDAVITLIVKSEDGNRELTRVRTPETPVGWSGGPRSEIPWCATFRLDLRPTMASLPQGRYTIVCEWPEADGHPQLSASPISIDRAHVTLEQARATALPTDKVNSFVKLVLDEKTIKSGEVHATLINESLQWIRFVAYVNELKEPDAGDKIWMPLHSLDVYKPSGWHSWPIGWCGTGTGMVLLQPGKSAHVVLTVPRSDSDIVRARIRWTYANHDPSLEPSETVSNAFISTRR